MDTMISKGRGCTAADGALALKSRGRGFKFRQVLGFLLLLHNDVVFLVRF